MIDQVKCEPWDFEDPDAFNACTIEEHSREAEEALNQISQDFPDDSFLPDAASFSDPIAYSIAYERAVGNLPYHYMHGIPATSENVANRGAW